MAKKNIEITPSLAEVKFKLQNTRAAMKDMRGPFSKIAVTLDRWVQSNIKTEGGKYGGWKPFKAGGRYTGSGNNRRLDGSAKLLRDTGRLASSFIPFSEKNDAGIGTDLPYAKAHDEGMGHIPQRKILPEDSNVEIKLKSRMIIDSHVNKVCKGFKL